MNLTTDSPTAKKIKKKILGRKSLIQKTDGEYPTSNSDDKKSDSKKLLRSNQIPKYSTVESDSIFTYRKEDINYNCYKKSEDEMSLCKKKNSKQNN